MQLDKRVERRSRSTVCHRRAHAGVEHPRRQHRTGSVRYLEHGNVFSSTVLAIRDGHFGAELRMPSVVDDGDLLKEAQALQSMSRKGNC